MTKYEPLNETSKGYGLVSDAHMYDMLVKQEVFRKVEEHYRKTFKRLVNGYGKLMGSVPKAEDVVQEAYTRALTYWKSYKLDMDIDSWLRTIVHNCIKDNFKTELLRGMIDQALPETVTKTSTIPAVILSQVLKRIDNQPNNIKKVLYLNLIEQYRPAEIAQVVPESVGAIRTIVFEFRKKIREEFNWKI